MMKMIKKKTSLLITACLLLNFSVITFSQNRVIISDEGGIEAHESAILELKSTDKGFLLPGINGNHNVNDPAEALIIFNSFTQCFNIYLEGEWHDIWCYGEDFCAVTADNDGPYCEGETIHLTASPIGEEPFEYSWTGPDGFTSTEQNPEIPNATSEMTGTYTVVITDDNDCVAESSTEVVIETVPDAPEAGTHVPDEEEIEWNWSTVPDADGYAYNTEDDFSGATSVGTNTTYLQTGLGCGESHTLYVWAYNHCGESEVLVLNSSTTDCESGCPSNVTDYDGNVYPVVQIGDKCWMAKNLRVTHYPDGTEIPYITDTEEWRALGDNNTDDAYTIYNNNANDEVEDYGKLYTYATAIARNWARHNEPGQGICPDGWYLPTREEFQDLIDFAGGQTDAPPELKEPGTDRWCTMNNSTNSTGFTAVGAGQRQPDDSVGDDFRDLKDDTHFWAADEEDGSNAYYLVLFCYDMSTIYPLQKSYGFSVRCVQDPN